MASSGPGGDRQEFDWDLPVNVPTIGVHRTLRVTSNESVGAVMIKLASKLGDADWSDYGLWWPEQGVWLNKPRQTLHGYGIMSDNKLEFVPIHRFLTIELPNRQRYQVRVNFAIMILYAVAEVCKEFGIRHPEELSLMRSPNDKENYAKFTGWTKRRKKSGLGSREGTPVRDGDNISVNSGDILGDGKSPPGSPARKRKYPNMAMGQQGQSEPDGSGGIIKTHMGEPSDGGYFSVKFYQSPVERCYNNGLWLDSSSTLYEQDVKEHDYLYLRFKYFSFMDIDPRVDKQRIVLLYEQAKHSVLTEEVDCTEEEAFTFAALKLQVKQADPHTTSPMKSAPKAVVDSSVTDIDAALNSLQVQLGQVDMAPAADTGPSLQLAGDIKFSRPSRLTLRSPKKFFFVLKGNNLTYYKNEAEFETSGVGSFIQKFTLTGAECIPDVDVSKRKYALNIILPSSDETGEIRLVFENSEEYASWAAGCRMVMKGRPLAKSGYEQELASIRSFIAMQNSSGSSTASAAADKVDLKPEDLVGPRLLKKKKAKDIARHILEAHASMLNLSVMDAKLQYIRNWQALQDFGISYFLVKVGRSKKEELLGVAYNRLILMDIHTRDQKKTWRYSAMKSWNVNWESKQLRVDHEEEKLLFQCLSADLKIIHEFIGGNIWLSLRNDKDPLDVPMFVKLTGGMTNNLSGWGSEKMSRALFS